MSTLPDPESASNDCPRIPPAQVPRSQPSAEIDSVICALISHIDSYADEDFDTQWMSTTDAEIELLVIQLVRSLLETTIGKRLSAYLLSIRASNEGFCKQTPYDKGLESDVEEIIAQIQSSGEFLFPDVL